jgi:hypothetical protein
VKIKINFSAYGEEYGGQSSIRFLAKFYEEIKSYEVVCATIFLKVISVPLARMEFWHMEAPYATVIRPLIS